MRFFQINILDPKTGMVLPAPGFGTTTQAGKFGPATYTSYVNNQTLPAAWNIEMSIPLTSADLPQGNNFLRIWGIPLTQIRQAANLNGKNIVMYGGMAPGLPLATPPAYPANGMGLLFKGYIFRAYGNWIGTAQTLDLNILPGEAPASPPPGSATTPVGGTGSVDNPQNFTIKWPAGMTLSQALKNCIKVALPNAIQKLDTISPALVSGQNIDSAPFPSFGALSEQVRSWSTSIIKTPNYSGVSLLWDGNTVSAWDSIAASTANPVQINFQDFIGQPTWLAPLLVSAKFVMRADLSVGQTVILPNALVTNTQGGASSIANQQPSFEGKYTITKLWHCGESRNPSADAWVTIAEMTPLQNQS
jgi:hypothetical protein